MKVSQIFEAKEPKTVVVYGGRFQPFHLGHYKAYQWLCKKFGRENVWIATSNKTNFDPKKDKVSPLNFRERKEIMMNLYGIPERRIVMCHNPAFSPEEVLKHYKNHDVAYVAAVGDKDGARYSSNYKKLSSDTEEVESLSPKKGPYYMEIPKQSKGISGTEVRDAILNASDDDLETVFKKYFGKYDSMVARLLKTRFEDIK